MIDVLAWLRRRSTRIPTTTVETVQITGFVYAPDEDPREMATAAPNLTLGTFRDEPPYIVVDHVPQSAILAKWPGRLWKVKVLQKASDQPYPEATYTRAAAVQVIEEMPLSVLFGYNGESVVEFLNSISRLTGEETDRLGGAADEEAAQVHNQVWDRWLDNVDPSSSHRGGDHAGVIAMGPRSSQSPVGNATSVLYSEVMKLAERSAGEGAFVDDGEDRHFNSQWSRIADNLQHCLFGLGADEGLLTETERAILCRVHEKAALRKSSKRPAT